jgi:hypothetical protein
MYIICKQDDSIGGQIQDAVSKGIAIGRIIAESPSATGFASALLADHVQPAPSTVQLRSTFVHPIHKPRQRRHRLAVRRKPTDACRREISKPRSGDIGIDVATTWLAVGFNSISVG